jgi:hypothetical protein
MTKRYGLSKTKLTAFEQCPRRLWLSVHRPELAQESDLVQQGFASGHEVGALACAALSDGVMIEAEPDLGAAIARTTELVIAGDRPLFEATFVHDGLLVRVDIMEPDGAGGWRVAEVKSTTGAKAYHWADLATQLWVMRESGIKISGAAIRHLDRGFRLDEAGVYEGLFLDSSAPDLEPIIQARPNVASAARTTLAGPEPDIAPGAQCGDPFACPFEGWCGRDLPPPPEWPIALLPRTGAMVAAHWAEKGVHDLSQVPEGAFANRLHDRIHRATLTGIAYHDRDGACAVIDNWAYPRIYLDFETIQHVVPRWMGTGPYGQVPFQFSAHIEEADGDVQHVGFLSTDGADPRPAITEALAALPGQGAVIAYNAAFERRCLLDLAEAVPTHAEALRSLASRLVDLLPVTRYHWYHRDQRGSWSIKHVLPTIAPELDYAGLEVKDGTLAMEAWREAADPATTSERHAAIRVALEAYCARDTFAMVILLRRLIGIG